MTDLLRALEQHFARLARAERHRAELLIAVSKARNLLVTGDISAAQQELHNARTRINTELRAAEASK